MLSVEDYHETQQFFFPSRERENTNLLNWQKYDEAAAEPQQQGRQPQQQVTWIVCVCMQNKQVCVCKTNKCV